MLGDLEIAVIIPGHEASDTIQSVIRGLPAFVDRIVVVDDGSSDQTGEAALACGDSRVTCLSREHRGGVGAAMVTGLAHILDTTCDVVVKIDADGQMDPGQLASLLSPIVEGGFDYAKGNRFYDRAALADMPLARRLGNMALSFLTKAASGYWNVYDPQNGYTSIRRDVLERLDLDSLDPGYFFENSMLVQLNIIGARVAEVPMPARYGQERSRMKLARVVLVFPWKLLGSGLTRIRLKYFGMDFSPIAVLLSVGGTMALGGTVYGVYEWLKHALLGLPTPAGQVMLAALPVLFGAQMLLHALLLDIAQTPSGLGIRRISAHGQKSHTRFPSKHPRKNRS